MLLIYNLLSTSTFSASIIHELVTPNYDHPSSNVSVDLTDRHDGDDSGGRLDLHVRAQKPDSSEAFLKSFRCMTGSWHDVANDCQVGNAGDAKMQPSDKLADATLVSTHS